MFPAEDEKAREEEHENVQEEGYEELLEEASGPEKPVKHVIIKRKREYSDYRYRSRMFKGSILPILYGIISLMMLMNYNYMWPERFRYEFIWVLAGFLLGLVLMLGITMINLIGAKRNPEEGYVLRSKIGLIAFIPFLIILLALAFFDAISTSWQFSAGFFLAPIFPLIFVILFEVGTKGKFFVREVVSDPSKGRKLVFIR